MDERQDCDDLLGADLHNVFVDRLPAKSIVMLPSPIEPAELLPVVRIFRFQVALYIVANVVRLTRDEELPGWISVDGMSSGLVR